MAADATHKPVYVFDGPRTCSQVFGKVFMAHPDLEHVFMNMMGPSVYGPEKNIWRGRQHCEAAETSFTALTELANNSGNGMFPPESYTDQAKKIEQVVTEIRARGKTAWIKDHTFCIVPTTVMDTWLKRSTWDAVQLANPTPFTTDFLDSVTPVFLFRHPALTIPSWLRMMKSTVRNQIQDEDFQICTTLYWTRLIFDSYLIRHGIDPKAASPTSLCAKDVALVIETQDFIYHTETSVDRVCHFTGVAKYGVQFEWEPTPEEEQPPSALAHAFFQDMFKSTGIQRAKKPAESFLDLTTKLHEWTEEFGAKTAKQLFEVVTREVENYEYLKKFKFQVK